jgi:hypothetical protein
MPVHFGSRTARVRGSGRKLSGADLKRARFQHHHHSHGLTIRVAPDAEVNPSDIGIRASRSGQANARIVSKSEARSILSQAAGASRTPCRN